jgi:hypothetical protein
MHGNYIKELLPSEGNSFIGFQPSFEQQVLEDDEFLATNLLIVCTRNKATTIVMVLQFTNQTRKFTSAMQVIYLHLLLTLTFLQHPKQYSPKF